MDQHQRSKDWIKSIASHLDLSLSKLAGKSGLGAITITRFINDTTGTLGVSEKTLNKISEFSGIPVYQSPNGNLIGVREPEAVPFDYDLPTNAASETIRLWVDDDNNRDAWISKGQQIGLSGILPNDVLIIDRSASPKPDDIVCAQILDYQTGSAKTVMRLYQPPFIVGNSAQKSVRPEIVDNNRVSIHGTVIASFRFNQK